MSDRLVYPAIAERNGAGGLGIWFPDFPGCVSATDMDDLDRAETSAQEALELHVEGMVQDGEILPRATHYNRIGPEDVDMTLFRSILLIDIPDLSSRMPPVERINTTLPKALLRRIDRVVEAKRFPSRAKFLAEAARRLLDEVA